MKFVDDDDDDDDGINQMTVFEIIIAVLHCLSDCMLAYYA